MRIIAVGLVLGAALVGGCSKHEATVAGGASRPAASVSSALGARPHPKAGLWRTSVFTSAGPGFNLTGELCLDASTEDSAFAADGRGVARNCEPTQFEPTGEGFAFTAVCHSKGRTITTKGLATGDFKNSYALDLSTHVEPARGLPPELHTTMKATWLGPCRPGQKPGRASMKFGGFGQG